MNTELQKAKSAAFRALHGGNILILPNAWDVASARVFAQSGFGAIATTSAGIAFTLGYPDGQRISREEMLAVVRRIAAGVQVPVTADEAKSLQESTGLTVTPGTMRSVKQIKPGALEIAKAKAISDARKQLRGIVAAMGS